MKQQQARELLTDLFESWYPALLRYSYRLTRDLELAEDVVQDSFLELYRNLARGTDIDNPKGWTLTVVRRRILHHYRNLKREGLRVEYELLDTIAGKPDPEIQRFLSGDLASLFNVLSPREEEVLLLRLESLKYREIGDRLGISANSVTTLLSRALKKLRLASAPATHPHDREEAHATKTLR